MSDVYAVRCNFARPDLEDEWNGWYGGPKLREMMTHRGFLSGQRYRAVGLDDRIRYLALWVVESPAAFETPEYKASWGFVQWAPHITDWSRNLFRIVGGAQDAGWDVSSALDVPPDARLYVLALDGMDAAEAERRRPALASRRPGLLWLSAVGLDRSIPMIGVRRLGAGETIAPLAFDLVAGARETIYEPISVRLRSMSGRQDSEVRA